MHDPEKIRADCIAIGGQRAAARRLGVNERTVRRWVAGEMVPHPPARKLLKVLADAAREEKALR